MIYNVRHILRILNWARAVTSSIVTSTGFMFIVLLALISFASIVEPEVEAGTMNLGPVVRTGRGFVGWLFIAVFWAYVISHVAPRVMRFRNWWVHSESHKITRKVFTYIWEGG